MNFNAPIANGKMPVFSEGSSMAPSRDDRNVNQLWKKVEKISEQTMANGKALQKTISHISKMRRKPLGGFAPPATTNQPFPAPFQFYNVTPDSGYAINNAGTGYADTDTGIELIGGVLSPGSSATTFAVTQVTFGSGIVTKLTVLTQGSYSTKPTYPASVSGGSGTGLKVTAISSTDVFRAVQMRNGLIGLRPRFSQFDGLGSSTLTNIPGMSNCDDTYGNYQEIYQVAGDGISPYSSEPSSEIGFQAIMLGPEDVPTILFGYVISSTVDEVAYPLIILNAPSDGTPYQAGFWLEIHDNLTEPIPANHTVFVNLVGKMYNNDGSDNPFPSSNASASGVNIIPLCVVQVDNSQSDSPSIWQFASGNLINSFDAYFNNTPVMGGSGLAPGTKTCFRGDWTLDALSGQYFYPGDTVRDVSSNPDLNNTIYVCLNYVIPASPTPLAPSSDATNWLELVN